MKVLIITYYWPPAGGSGVQRWLKFVKYFKEFNITPIIYTVNNEDYPSIDSTLEHDIPEHIEVLKQTIWKPTDLIFWNKSKKKTNTVSNIANNSFLSFIRGNFFIPDPKVFWVNKSVTYLNEYILKNQIDVVISTGPPHSMHLIARRVAKKNNIKWLADFRDPWTQLYYNESFKQLSFSKKLNQKLEKSVLNEADCILTVSQSLSNEFRKNSNRVEVVTNGYDNDKYSRNINLDNKFTISYIGLLPPQSNPKVLFKVLSELCKSNESFSRDLQLNFIGDISNQVYNELSKHNLIKKTNFHGYVSHDKALVFQRQAQVLLLLVPNVINSKGILTGKFFEYLTSNRPILALGPKDGDLAKILNETQSGTIFDYKEDQDLKKHINQLYLDYTNNNLKVYPKNIEKYHRKNLTEQLVTVLKSLLS